MDERPVMLIAALSGRALAQSARRGGYRPLVADFFGDSDTLEAALAHVRLTGDLANGIKENTLMEALAILRRRRRPIGLVYGSGFEDRTQILRRIASRWRLFGNDPTTVASIKDPTVLSAICASAKIPFPELSFSKPKRSAGWLRKRQGGAGGGHIRPASRRHFGAGTMYYQRKVPGTAVSAAFLAGAGRARVLGFSAQWSLPAPGRPYRYGGAVRPAALTPKSEALLAAAVERLVAATPLVGLNSADFMVDDERFWLLEVNPRPGATLDIFEPAQGSLFALHVAACAGCLTAAPAPADGVKAAAIVYAEEDIPAVPPLIWPPWTADRPIAGTRIRAAEPLCTVYACGCAAAAARALAEERRKTVLALTRARKS
ncbi:MAG TPA: ATP-grasp domain-containing protein [Xanthobacteraceae bacterium]|jgi:predicted ATP-grasp superfamily ATP-dependent carboligase